MRLANGDRLTGTLVRLEEGTLLFETDYAGEIGIDWEAVEVLTVEEPASAGGQETPATHQDLPAAPPSIHAVNV